jgi:colanic acid biosynthesis glycosyl transferase WcaI
MECVDKKPRRVLLLTRYFPPEIGTAATLFFDLAQELTRQGVEVVVVTGFPWYNLREIPEQYRRGVVCREQFGPIEIIRMRLNVPGPRKLRLFIGHLLSPISVFFGGLLAGKVDIIYGYSPPLLIGIAGRLLKKLKGCPFVLGVQDLHPQAYIDQGVLRNTVLIRILEGLERTIYKGTDSITVHSEGNRRFVQNKLGAHPADQVCVISNWVDVAAMNSPPGADDFKKIFDVEKKFVVGYAGTLGLSQGSGIIVEAAHRLSHLKDLVFVVVADGIDKKALILDCERRNLVNIRFFDLQPAEKYPAIVAAFDLGIVTLNAKVRTPVVPSKILSLMASGTPIVGSLPKAGDSTTLIESARCGLVAEPGNSGQFAKFVETLYSDHRLREDCGANGQAYAATHFSLPIVTRSLIRIFKETIAGSDL